VEKGEIPSH
jgi:GAG-pre-integrase domain